MPEKVRKIGALTIGQSPRPDLVDPLVESLPADCQVIQAGALDGISPGSLPATASGAYPLSTRLADGTPVLVDEAFLSSRLQRALYRLEEDGAVASILLCAGSFARLQGCRPLFKPFATAQALLRLLGIRTLGLITPVAEQVEPMRQRWQKAGFAATAWSADLAHQDRQFREEVQHRIEAHRFQMLLLDYVGYPVPWVEELRVGTSIPVIDLGQLSMATLVTSLAPGIYQREVHENYVD